MINSSLMYFMLALFVAPGLRAAEETVVRHYDWITAETVSGSHVLTIHADGTRESEFEFNDRKKEPKRTETPIILTSGN